MQLRTLRTIWIYVRSNSEIDSLKIGNCHEEITQPSETRNATRDIVYSIVSKAKITLLDQAYLGEISYLSKMRSAIENTSYNIMLDKKHRNWL